MGGRGVASARPVNSAVSVLVERGGRDRTAVVMVRPGSEAAGVLRLLCGSSPRALISAALDGGRLETLLCGRPSMRHFVLLKRKNPRNLFAEASSARGDFAGLVSRDFTRVLEGRRKGVFTMFYRTGLFTRGRFLRKLFSKVVVSRVDRTVCCNVAAARRRLTRRGMGLTGHLQALLSRGAP